MPRAAPGNRGRHQPAEIMLSRGTELRPINSISAQRSIPCDV
jgi:hypothetical protein